MADREYEVEIVRFEKAIAKRNQEKWRDELDPEVLCCVMYRSTNYVQWSPYGWDKIMLSVSSVSFDQACRLIEVLSPGCSFISKRM